MDVLNRRSFSCSALSAALTGCATAPSPVTSRSAGAPLLFRNALLWSGDAFLEDLDVATTGGSIIAVARRFAPPRGARVIDARGMTLIPGLIDAHTHFFDLGARLDFPGVSELVAATIPASAPATLASGVTTARIHFSHAHYGPALARAAERDDVASPRIILGGPGLLGGEPTLNRSSMRGVVDAADASSKVRAIRAVGSTWLSIGNPDRFPPEVWAAIVREARASNMRLMIDIDTPSQLDTALAARADSLEAGLGEVAYNLSDMSRYSGFTFALPLGYYRNLTLMRAAPELIDDPRPLRFMRSEVAASIRESLRRQFAEEAATPRERAYDQVAANFAALHRAGARIAIASDSGSQGQFHTDAIWNEMAAWRAAGISVPSILRSATSIPAALFERSDIGRVAPGLRADLALCRGDLRQGEFDPASVKMVVKGGNVLLENGELTALAVRPVPEAPA